MSIRVPEEQENEEPIESISGVSAKHSLKVKSVIEESPRTQKYES